MRVTELQLKGLLLYCHRYPIEIEQEDTCRGLYLDEIYVDFTHLETENFLTMKRGTLRFIIYISSNKKGTYAFCCLRYTKLIRMCI